MCLIIHSSKSHCTYFPERHFVLLMCAVYGIMVWNKSVMSVFVLGPDWSCGLISTCCVVSHTSSVSCSACQGWTRSLRSLSLAEPFRATAFSIQWRFYQNIRVNVQKCLQGVRTNKHAFWGSDLENLIHAMKFSIIKPLPAKCVFMFSPNVYQLFAYLELADCWNIPEHWPQLWDLIFGCTAYFYQSFHLMLSSIIKSFYFHHLSASNSLFFFWMI